MNMIRRKRSLWEKEKRLSDFIPFSSVIAPGIVYCRNGELISTFRLEGIAFETSDNELTDIASMNLNSFYCNISKPTLAIQTHRVRRYVTDKLSVPKENGFAKLFTNACNELNASYPMMATELYLTVIEVPASKKSKTGIREAKDIEDELKSRIEEFENVVHSFEMAFAPYRPKRLESSVDPDTGILVSEQLSFYNFLITGQWQKIQVPLSAPLYETLGNVQVFAGYDTLEFQTPQGSVFAQSLEIKDYPSTTNSRILDTLFYNEEVAPYPFVETQTFCMKSKRESQEEATKKQNHLLAAEDRGINQIRQINDAIQDMIAGSIVLGEYSYSLLVFGDLESVRKNTLAAHKTLSDKTFTVQIGTLALTAAWLHQLPGKPKWRPRVAMISSYNFAHLAPMHNFPSGKRDGNPWGEAMALFRTPSNQPFYFSCHVSPDKKDSTGDKDSGNTVVIGYTGSGKTALCTGLLTFAQKYRDSDHKLSCIYFDLDKGAEVAIKALGGGYVSIENGKPTGLNPFQLEANPKNIQFLNRLVQKMLETDGQKITASQRNQLNDAIEAVMNLPKEVRRLALLPQNLVQGNTAEERENSLTQRLTRWIEKGELAWVFDNPVNTLDFDEYPIFGIDATDFLDHPVIHSVVTDYLLYRLTSIIDGRRLMIFMDEFWKFLRDPDTASFALKQLKTIRKQNGIMIFATQNPEDLSQCADGPKFIQNCATHIFLANPKATEEQYVKEFSVTPLEFWTIKKSGTHSRLMIIKQEGNSVRCRFDLSGTPKAIKVLSGNTGDILFAEDLMRIFGDEPEAWLPYYWGEKQLTKEESAQLSR